MKKNIYNPRSAVRLPRKFFLCYIILLFLFCNSGFVAGSDLQSLKNIYKTGKIRFVKEVEISRDSLPEDVNLKTFGNFEIWRDKIFITDPWLCDIKVFDTSGKYLEKIGQKGSGPADLNIPLPLCMAGENLVVWEISNFRFSLFSYTGKFVRHAKIGMSTGRVRRIASLDDGRVIIERELTGYVKGEYIQYFGLELYSKDLEFKKIILKKSVNRYLSIQQPTRRILPRPFSTDVYWAVMPGNKLVIGYSDSYKVEIWEPGTGIIKSFSGKYEPVKISDQEKKQYLENMISGSNGRMEKGASPFMRKYATFPAYKPAFRSIICDIEGNILVFVHKEIEGGKSPSLVEFDTFDSNGNFMNHVEVVSPGGLGLGSAKSIKGNLFWIKESNDGLESKICLYRAFPLQ